MPKLRPRSIGIKCWLLVDRENKYICNAKPYLGPDGLAAAAADDDDYDELEKQKVVENLLDPFLAAKPIESESSGKYPVPVRKPKFFNFLDRLINERSVKYPTRRWPVRVNKQFFIFSKFSQA